MRARPTTDPIPRRTGPDTLMMGFDTYLRDKQVNNHTSADFGLGCVKRPNARGVCFIKHSGHRFNFMPNTLQMIDITLKVVVEWSR